MLLTAICLLVLAERITAGLHIPVLKDRNAARRLPVVPALMRS